MRHMFPAFVFAACLVFISLPSRVLSLDGLQVEVVHDPNTGVALYGFDPVEIFLERDLVSGIEAYEYRWGGVVWRFASYANLQAFKSSPEYYAPEFSGYDPVQVSRGTLTAGLPEYWDIGPDSKLYLFHSPTMLAIWKENQARILADAQARWSELSR